MIPINKVPVGKFCRFDGNIVYIYNNDFKNSYGVFPIEGSVPQDKAFNHKVYVYKRVKKSWIENMKEQLYLSHKHQQNPNLDNLTYIENLNILQNYLKGVIVDTE
jgi:hypothetical protein